MNQDVLIRGGIDYEEGLHRFGGKPQIYEKYLLKYFAADELPALRQALENGAYDDAFRIAHNMKGGAGNLSVSAFFNKICQMVDALRAGVRDGSLLVLCSEAEKLYETACTAVKEASRG